MIMKKVLIILSFILFFTLSFSETLTGKALYVSDGDTLTMSVNGQKEKIRFYGIDAPESSQEFGLESKVFVKDRIDNKEIRVEITDTDRYGRKIGKIYYDDKYLNEEIVRAGYAWWYQQYARRDMDLKEAEEYAKAQKIGLWKSTGPIAPWDYRRGRRSGGIETTKNIDDVVYVTKSGKKYHREGCRYLRSIYASYTLKEAEALGYEACNKYLYLNVK